MRRGETGLESADGAETPARGRPIEGDWDPELEPGPRSDLSGFAVASLVFGVIGGVLFSPLFGLIALAKIKRTGQRGRGLAVAGLVLSGVWLLVLAVVFGVNRYVVHRAEDVVALRIGQCFDLPAAGGDDAFVPGPIATLPCEQAHRAEMVGWVSPGDELGNAGGYPGAAALVQLAESGCPSVSRDYVLDPLSLPADVHPRWYVPRASEWVRGGQSITCFLVADRSPVSRSLREDAAIVNADQLRFLLAIRDCAELVARVDALRAGGPSAELLGATARTADAWSTMGVELQAELWPSTVQPAMDRLVADIEAVLPLWQDAAEATNDNDLRDRIERAQQRTDPDHMPAVRRALRLSTTQGEPLPRP
jgi:hypothetical protein